ncbi:MAG: carbon starvation protein A [Propionibacteriaceae bacterium]|jgi:carbon starvation protein|nr:carbon starvation protein A [Propionibacteriaceae bacterium]
MSVTTAPDPTPGAPASSRYTPEEEKHIIRNKEGIPVGIAVHENWTPLKIVIWAAIALFGAVGWTMLAIVRGENVNTVWFVVAAVCTYLIAYRFYALFIQKKIMRPDDTNATPAERINNGQDYDPTDRRVLYGHHFAAIAGAGPLVGPVLAAQMGYLPGTIWIIVGVCLAGAVQDMLVLFFSLRRGGRSLGQMARDEIGTIGGTVAMIGVFVMLMIVLAVLALICVNAMTGSPWSVFSIGCTIPIALLMGLYLRYLRPGRVSEVSILGFILLITAIIAGNWVAQSPLGDVLTLSGPQLVLCMVVYGFFAAVLPVWLLLTPRDYLSTFMKVGTIVLLAVGIVLVQPIAQTAAVTEFASNTEGPVFAGALFPFLFITIACGALSGMHATVSSGTTPKMIQKESQARMVGYGGMIMESFVAIMALAAAVSINTGVYFSMNMSTAGITNLAHSAVEAGVLVDDNGDVYQAGDDAPTTARALTADQVDQWAEDIRLGSATGASAEQVAAGNAARAESAAVAVTQLNVTDAKGERPKVLWDEEIDGAIVSFQDREALEQLAEDVGEPSIVSRTGGAPTLAVAMADILHRVFGGRGMMSFWFHFAVMFEALFILSAVDAVTRVTRFQLSEAIGNWVPKFRDTSWRPGAWLCTALVVASWGSLLYMGVTDPRGGIQTLYPLFGIANQLIAAIALMICTVVVVRKGYVKWMWIPIIPLVWDVATTFTASFYKIFSADPALGYWKQWSNARATKADGGLDETTLQATDATIRNTFIQGTLSIVFLAIAATVLVACVIRIVTTIRSQRFSSSEDPYQESRYFAPVHFLATGLEKKVEREYAEVGDPALLAGHGGKPSH